MSGFPLTGGPGTAATTVAPPAPRARAGGPSTGVVRPARAATTHGAASLWLDRTVFILFGCWQALVVLQGRGSAAGPIAVLALEAVSLVILFRFSGPYWRHRRAEATGTEARAPWGGRTPASSGGPATGRACRPAAARPPRTRERTARSSPTALHRPPPATASHPPSRRDWLLPAMRLCICLPSSVRSAGVRRWGGLRVPGPAGRAGGAGSGPPPRPLASRPHAQVGPALLLEHAPRPGPLGLLADVLHVLQGTRVLIVGVLPFGLPLPPMAALVTQAGTTLMTYNAPAFCGTQASRYRQHQCRYRQQDCCLGGAVPGGACRPQLH